MNSQCIVCSMPCTDVFCSQCNLMNRGQKFAQLLVAFEKCSNSDMYYHEIISLVQKLRQVSFLNDISIISEIFKTESIMAPIEFYPNQVFDERKHSADIIAMEYVEKANNDVHHLVPAEVPVDGNCLYHSIVLLMNDPKVTANELRGK